MIRKNIQLYFPHHLTNRNCITTSNAIYVADYTEKTKQDNPVECGRGAAALYVGEVGLTALEPKVHVVQLRRELAHRNGVNFRDDDDAVFLAAFIFL